MDDLITKLAAPPQQTGPVVPDAPFDLDVKLCTATYVISSSAIDNDGDILVPEGSLPHLQRFTSNPVVLWNHDRDMAPVAQSINPITKQLSWNVETERVKATAHFHLMTQESAQCWALVENNILRGASVGYDEVPGKTIRMREPGLRFKFVEWVPLEWSVVPIPNNPETLLEAVNRQWDGKSLSPSIVKSLMAYVPKTTTTIVSMVQPRQYVKHQLPWVQSRQKAIKESAMADDATQPVEEVKDDGSDTPSSPPGAQAIMGFTADIESALANLNTALGSIENPDVLSLFEGVGTAIEDQVIALKDGLKAIYPDLDLEKADENVDGETEVKAKKGNRPCPDCGGTGKGDDGSRGNCDRCRGSGFLFEDEKAKSLKKSKCPKCGGEGWVKQGTKDVICPRCTGSGEKSIGDHMPHIQAIQDAGEIVKEMSDSPNVPKSYRMACKGVHGGLMTACDYMHKSFSTKADDGKPEEKPEEKPAEEPEEKADDEVSEDDIKAIKSLQAELAGIRKEVTRTTGKVQ